MTSGIRCLALSVDIGAGHRSAAEALCQAIVSLRPGSSYEIIEALEYLGPGAGKLAKELYFGVLEDAPELWGSLYKHKGLVEIFRPIGEFIDDLRTFELEPVIRLHRPNIVFAMHPIACGLAGALARGGDIDCPAVAVLTDFDAHPAWIADGIEMYFAPFRDVALDLEKQHLPTGSAVATGLPLRSDFENIRLLDRKDAALANGLAPDLFTILLLGGGLGLGPIAETAEMLASLDHPFQLVVISGKNRKLENSARALAGRSSIPIHARGHVGNIQEYMAASDLAVGKPGGSTCAELLAAGVPLIALAPIPGQEQANCDALERKGVAVHAADAHGAYVAVAQILRSPEKLDRMKQAAIRIGNPGAAREAAGIAISLADDWPSRKAYGQTCRENPYPAGSGIDGFVDSIDSVVDSIGSGVERLFGFDGEKEERTYNGPYTDFESPVKKKVDRNKIKSELDALKKKMGID